MNAGLESFNAEAQRAQSKRFRESHLNHFFVYVSAALCVLCVSAVKGLFTPSPP